jgi:DNA polymerase
MYGLDLTIEESLICKNKWRAAHPLWVNAWHDLNTGAMTAVRCPKRVFKCGKVAWCFDGQHLKLRLPSGRIVWFPWAEIRDEATPWGQVKPMLSYGFTHPKTKQWCCGTTHGGALFNVVVQGTGACLMRYAARNLRRRGMDAVMRVHDEVVIEGVDSFDAFNTFKATMLEVPPWAEGLRLNGAGFTAKRYKKD